MVPNSRAYIDMTLLLTCTLFDDFFLALYHSSIACIRQQSHTGAHFGTNEEFARRRKKLTTNSNELPSFGALLKTFRKRRHLTQQQLAEAIGMQRHAIGRWEQGDVLPASKTMVLELAKHLCL